MTPTLLSEMAQGSFQPLRDKLDREQEYTPDEVRDLVRACAFGASVLDKLRERLEGLLHDGMEGRKLAFFLNQVTSLIELAMNEVYPRVRSITAGEILPTEERRSSLETLDELTRRAAAMRSELASLEQWLKNPPPQGDLESITGKNASPHDTSYQDIDDIIGRLRAGGDI
jgi:hypothetical protein